MFKTLSIIIILFISSLAQAQIQDILRLQKAYPDHIQLVTEKYILWMDGTKMPLFAGKKNKTEVEKFYQPALYDQVSDVSYPAGLPVNAEHYKPTSDPGRIRFEPFFKKMYGQSQSEVANHLTTIYWMPGFFGKKYPLKVTTVNHVDQRLQLISNQLELLLRTKPQYRKFLENPGGTFKWRNIANTPNLSMHSFGMTIDINTQYSDYWQWTLRDEHRPIQENATLGYKNRIPWEIVLIFEKYGFIWGGKWYHYDTMHFEYRPELLVIS